MYKFAKPIWFNVRVIQLDERQAFYAGEELNLAWVISIEISIG